MTCFLDVEAPEDTRHGDEEGLFGNLLAGTNSATPSEGRVTLLIRIREILFQVPIGIERMWIGVVFGVVINLLSEWSPRRWGGYSPEISQNSRSFGDEVSVIIVILGIRVRCSSEHRNRSPSERLFHNRPDVR